MKKLLTLLLCTLIIFSFYSCDTESSKEDSNTTNNPDDNDDDDNGDDNTTNKYILIEDYNCGVKITPKEALFEDFDTDYIQYSMDKQQIAYAFGDELKKSVTCKYVTAGEKAEFSASWNGGEIGKVTFTPVCGKGKLVITNNASIVYNKSTSSLTFSKEPILNVYPESDEGIFSFEIFSAIDWSCIGSLNFSDADLTIPWVLSSSAISGCTYDKYAYDSIKEYMLDKSISSFHAQLKFYDSDNKQSLIVTDRFNIEL